MTVILVLTSTLYEVVCSSVAWYVITCGYVWHCIRWYVVVCSGMQWYVVLCSGIWSYGSHIDSTLQYFVVVRSSVGWYVIVQWSTFLKEFFSKHEFWQFPDFIWISKFHTSKYRYSLRHYDTKPKCSVIHDLQSMIQSGWGGQAKVTNGALIATMPWRHITLLNMPILNSVCSLRNLMQAIHQFRWLNNSFLVYFLDEYSIPPAKPVLFVGTHPSHSCNHILCLILWAVFYCCSRFER